MDDEYSDFSPSFIRLNGTRTVYWVDGFDVFSEVIAKDFDEASDDIIALLAVACLRYGDSGELEGEFLDTGMGLEEGELRYPVDYNNSIEFDEAQLKNFDLSRFYAISVWYEKAEIDDAFVRFIPETPRQILKKARKKVLKASRNFRATFPNLRSRNCPYSLPNPTSPASPSTPVMWTMSSSTLNSPPSR